MEYSVVFMGSPDFALSSLKRLHAHYQVKGGVTQPDKPSGRGRILTPPPVKVLAQSLGLPLIQPAKLREPDAMTQLREWAPDLIVVTAFGQILRQEVLDLPQYGCINVHASLLPRWRGAAPIQAAILNGDGQTGVTIMRMDAGVDSGPLLSQKSILIDPQDTAGSLSERLAQAGVELLIDTLPGYLDGSLIPDPQDASLATRAPMLQKEDGLLDFNQPAIQLANKVRAYNPWPGAYMLWEGQLLKIHRARRFDLSSIGQGVFAVVDGKPAVGAGAGVLVFDEVQPAGKKPMTGEAFLRGVRHWPSS